MSLAAFLSQAVGKPYEWGATGPDSYDCSGLVSHAIAACGGSGRRYTTSDLMKLPEREDGVIFTGEGFGRRHAGLVVGGYAIHATSSKGVIIEVYPPKWAGWRFRRHGR